MNIFSMQCGIICIFIIKFKKLFHPEVESDNEDMLRLATEAQISVGDR